MFHFTIFIKKKMKAITYQGQMKSPTSFTFILIGWFELFSAIFVCIYVCMYVFSVTRKKESIHLKSKLSLNLKNYLWNIYLNIEIQALKLNYNKKLS